MDLSGKKDDEDASKLSVSGSVEGKISIAIGDDIALAEVGDIKYEDGEFSVGEFSAQTDLSKFGYDKLGGKGSFSVKDLKFKNGETPKIGSMGISVSNITYNEKTLMSDLSVDIILDEKSESSGSAAKADEADLALDGLDGKLTGLNISVYLTDSFRGVKLAADKFSITPKNFEFAFDKFSGEFGSSSGSAVCNMQLGALSVKSDLTNNEIAKIIGIEQLEFTAENAAIKDNKFTIGKISASASGELNVAGFTVKSAQIDTDFDDTMNLRSLKIGGELGYKDYISGKASVKIDENGNLSFDEIADLKASYGCFEGSVKSIEKSANTVTFKELSLAKKSEKENGNEFDYDSSLVSKFLRTVPNIEIGLKELTFKDGSLVKPSLDKISINKIEMEFNVGKYLTGKIGYTGGEKGEFTIAVNSDLSVPDGGYEKAERIPIIKYPLPIIPVVLQAEFSLGFIAGATANFDINAKASRSEKKVNFDSEVAAKIQAKLGVYASAMLAANLIIASAEGGLVMSAALASGVDLTGKFGLTYDPSAEKFLESFKVNKEQTNLSYALNGDLEFKLDVASKIKGFPMVFHQKTLTHSWNLFNYKLGGVKLAGSLTYDPINEKYEFKGGKPEFTYGGDVKYQPEKVQDQIDDIGKNVTELQNSMKKINAMLQNAKGNVNKEKGSLDGIAAADEKDDLGGEINEAKSALMPELKQRINNVFKEGKKNSLKCHMLLVDLTKMINKNADNLSENQRNVEALERIMGESKALEITGFKAGGEFTADTYREYIEELKKLKADEKRLDKLSELEPAAVVNMFKAFKLGKTTSWEDLHDQAEELTDELTVEDVPDDPVYRSQIKPGIYATAMNDLDSMLKKKQDELKKTEALVEGSAQKVKDLERKKEALKIDVTNEINNRALEKDQIYVEICKIKGIKNQYVDEIAKQIANEDTKDALALAQSKYQSELKELEEKKLHILKRTYDARVAKANERYLETIEKRYKELAELIQNLQKQYPVDNRKLEMELGNAKRQHNSNTASLDTLKKQMIESGDISTAMMGFQEFVSQEYKGAQKELNNGQVKYGLKKKDEQASENSEKTDSKISETEKQKRRENVVLVIDRLIEDATEENLKKFDGSRHTERLKTLQDQSGIVDVNMRGFGLPENRKSNIAFNTMKSDNEKFQTMKTQLDETYKQMTGYHDVIRQALESWNTVNGLKFAKRETIGEFTEGTGQVVDLIKQVDDAEKNQISDENLSKISEEVKRLNGSDNLPTDGTAALSTDPKNDLVRLGFE